MEAESFHRPGNHGTGRAPAVFRFALEDFWRRRPARAEAKANLRTSLLALPYGDQGLLIPKRLYQKIGGYRAFGRHGRWPTLPAASGRRRLIVPALTPPVNVAAARPKSALRGFALTLLHTLAPCPSRLLSLSLVW